MESLTTIPPTTAIQKPTAKEHIQRSIQANQDHQFALKTYTERLEAELESLDKLLVCLGEIWVISRIQLRLLLGCCGSK